MRPFTLILAFAVLARLAVAQDPEPAPETKGEKEAPAPAAEASPPADAEAQAHQQAAALLSQALRRLRRMPDLVVQAAIEHKEAGGGGALGALPPNVRQRMFGQGLAPFTGNVEAWVASDGATVVLSESEVPGFGVYVAGERTVTQRTTADGRDVAVGNITQELVPLLDVMRLTRHLAEGKLAAKTDPATGEVTFAGELPRELVKPLGDGGFYRVRTLRVHATAVVEPEGRLKSLVIEVTHNDPIAESQRGGGVRIILQGGQGGPAVPVQRDDEDKHDIEGGKTTYRLEFIEAAPSARAHAFRHAIEKMLKAEKK